MFFKNLISEEDIADIKIKTNQIEKELSVEGKRKINLDPGYIGLAKLVLATTKDYSHRIYLRRGIYGEVTLIYRGNSFTPHINTYRDYSDREYIELFNLARNIYRGLLQKQIEKRIPICHIYDMKNEVKIIGQSKAIEEILSLVNRLAKSDSTVLIMGEWNWKRAGCKDDSP